MTVVLKKHYCSACGKNWDCPQGNECGKTPETTHDSPILCSRCFNKAKQNPTPKFGDTKHD